MIALSQCPGIDPAKDSSAALQAALNLRQPITWDCPVNCAMGADPTKSVFIPGGSDVTFTPRGQLTVDNIGFPALCLYHAAGVTWRGTRIRYAGSFGSAGIDTTEHIGGSWNDGVAKRYLASQGLGQISSANPLWTGPTNACAVISLKGSSSAAFQGGSITVPDGAPAASFVPVAVALDPAYAADSSLVSPTAAFTDFLLDGTLMGFVGSGTLAFGRITSRRYADLQDPSGANQGGVNTWFAPPHLFYLTAGVGAPMSCTLRDIVDEGVYCGAALRRSAASGLMHSAKLSANGVFVDGYYSRRLDGGLDYWSNGTGGGRVRNATFVVDTMITTVNSVQAVSGLRFPSAHPYPDTELDVTIKNRATNYWPAYTPMLTPGGMRLRLSVECGFEGT